jgi:alkanesulfonate monooxygenase
MFDPRIHVYSTCPPSGRLDGRSYLEQVARVAAWSDAAGCRGSLVYSDNSLADPWLLAQVMLQSTRALRPLIAVQPVYMHPYTLAKSIATLGHLHGRGIDLNLVAGGFGNDLAALRDATPHDRRYDRLVEYATIATGLLAGVSPVTFTGEFYAVDRLKLAPPLAPDLAPAILISGSSEAGLAAARALGATAIRYPKPAGDHDDPAPVGVAAHGIRVGVIARETEAEAWEIARARFPEERKGQIARQLASKVSDSVWHRQLAEMKPVESASPYWLVPFQNYKTMCPYLVGSYARVAEELARYMALGSTTFILDVPPDPDELQYTTVAFDRALERCLSCSQTG